MSSYQVTISFKGKFLFRTEVQPEAGTPAVDMPDVKELAKRFPKEQGFEVMLVTWPDQLGKMQVL